MENESSPHIFKWRGQPGRIDSFEIEGPMLITLGKFQDRRGSFVEYFNEELFQTLGLPQMFPQANLSETYIDVIRGLHFQNHQPQGKLVYCLTGRIMDVCMDLRKESPTFKHYLAINMQARNDIIQLLYVPPRFGHGFLAREKSLVGYLCSTKYDKDSEGGVHPLKSGVDWGQTNMTNSFLISEKDNQLPSLVEYEASL